MEEEQSNTFTRPYRSKRSRPCDICRGRKGYCRIEDAPPCQRCRKLNVACTFIEGPAKRQQTSYREDGTTTDQRAHFQGQASGSDTGLQSGSNGQPLPPSYPLAVTQDTQLFTQHDVLQDSSGSSFDAMDFAGSSDNELGDLLHNAASPRENRMNHSPHSQPNMNHGSRRGYAMVSETGVPPFDSPIDGKDGVHGLYLGLSGETDPYLLRHYKYDDHGDFRMFKLVFHQTANDLYNDVAKDLLLPISPSNNTRLDISADRTRNLYGHIPVPVQFMMAADELADDAKKETTLRPHTSPESIRMEIDQLIKPDDGIRLIGLFFDYVFPALPVASRFQFEINSFTKFPSIATLAKVPNHLLAAIYASSLAFYAYDDHLCVSNAYKKPPINHLWRIVFAEILREIHSPRLSVLQACLLYLQKPCTAPNSAAADTPFKWSFMAFTVGLATSLGLHVDCEDWCIPAWERRLRRRLWWIVYSEEKWRSLLVGQPSLISREQWDVSDLKDEDFILVEEFPESVGSPATVAISKDGVNALHFRWLANLALIADDVYQSFYTLRASRIMSRSFSLLLEAAQPLRRRLQAWYTSLPESLRMRDRSGSEDNIGLHSNASLHLAYLTLEILIYRALLHPLGRANGQTITHDSSVLHGHLLNIHNNSVGGSGETNLEAPFGELQAAAEATISAAEHCAKLATAFTAELSSRDFSGFWYSWSRIGFATMSNFVLLLLIQAPTTQHAKESKIIADTWRRTLRFQSKSCEQMNLGMLRLDAIYWSGMEKSFIVEPHVKGVL